jgi:fumarate reductase flavoprotein subunit
MKQLKADVVVVAAGSAGLAAAVTAAQGGAKVVVFEKASTPGGTSNQAEGIFAVESRLQRVKQIDLSKEDAFRIHMEFTHWRADPRLVRAYHDISASTIDWLEDLGLEWMDVACYGRGDNYTWHLIKTHSGEHQLTEKLGAGATLVKVLTDSAKKLGADLYLQTPAKKILRSRDRVTGVLAEDRSGEVIEASADVVVVATGGFGDNPEWIKKYTGYEHGVDMFSTRVPGLVGDGIRMAWEVGAAQGQMMMHHYASGPSLKQLNAVGFAFNHPNLAVNVQGNRFMNEEIMTRNLVFFSNSLARQKDRCAYSLFDGATKRYYEEVGLDFPGYGRPFVKAVNFDAELDKALDQGFDPTFDIFVADSLEEVAAKTGIPHDALLKTVDEYNEACDTGRDELFFKNPRYLRPVREPKFYVKKCILNGFGTLGGIKTNHRMEVLNKDLDIIPGLYAAGSDANELYGGDYAFILPGNTFGFAVNSGRIAGQSALEYLSSVR